MSSTSSDSEMSFDSEDSKINFIRGYEIAAAAYADDPLADKEWTSDYQKHVDVDKKPDSMKA